MYSDEAFVHSIFLYFNLESFFLSKYIYYEKSDRFPWNGGNQCGSAPVHHYIFSSVCGFPSRYLLRLTNQDSKSWTSVFCVTLPVYVCSHSFGISEQQKKDFPFIIYLGTFQWKNIYVRLKILADIFNILLRWFLIPYFIYSNFFVENEDYFVYWSLFHERLSTIATSISHEPLAVHCMIYINCCVTLSWKE